MFCKCLKKKCSLLVSNTPQRRRISLSRLNSLTLHRQAVISTKEVSKRLLLTAWPMYYQFFLVIPCRYIVMLKGVSTYETSFITEADKGEGIIVVDENHYNNKMNYLLSNVSVYRKVMRDDRKMEAAGFRKKRYPPLSNWYCTVLSKFACSFLPPLSVSLSFLSFQGVRA